MAQPGLQRLRVMETFRNLFYTPVYVAIGRGFLYGQGLEVQFSTVPEAGSAVKSLKDGSADFVQTGISRSFMDLDDGSDDAPLHVAEINQGDGFFLVSRQPADDWKWADLAGSTVIPVGFTPVPWTSLRSAMLSHGVDLRSVTLVEGLGAREALDRFRSGGADYIHMPHPQARLLEDEGAGHIAVALAPSMGYICYSSFAATPRFIEANPDVVQRFVNGFYEAQQWLASAALSDIVDTVVPFLPDVPRHVLEKGVEDYRAHGIWATDPMIGQEGFDTMRDVLIDGGVVKGRHSYDRVVLPGFARAAMGG